MSSKYGTQSIVASIDIYKTFFGQYKFYDHVKSRKYKSINIIDIIKGYERLGAGEIFLNIINKDGTLLGLDIEIAKLIQEKISIPLVVCGGLKDKND